MMVIKNRIIPFLVIIATIFLVDFISFDIAKSVENSRIIIDENLKPGMALKDAIDLLGPPESIKVSDIGTVVIPYSALGLSVEVLSDGTIIEGIHLQSNFRGRFASGLEIGVEAQKILTVYNQPDIMTKDIIEYSDIARMFQIYQGRLVGADLYSEKSTLYRQVSSKETAKHEKKEAAKYEDEETEEYEEVRVFDLYGFKVKNRPEGIIITEVRPGSVAEKGGLKVGEPIRKAFYKGRSVLNIYTATGLKAILERAINKGKKTINILQSENHYYKVSVPKRK